jgi:hypothetical protein
MDNDPTFARPLHELGAGNVSNRRRRNPKFAPPASELAKNVPVRERPTAGQGLALAATGKLPSSPFQGFRLVDADGNSVMEFDQDTFDLIVQGVIRALGVTFQKVDDSDADENKIFWKDPAGTINRSAISGGRHVAGSRSQTTVSALSEDGLGQAILSLVVPDSDEGEINAFCQDDAGNPVNAVVWNGSAESDFLQLTATGKKLVNFGTDTAATNGANSANKATNHGLGGTPSLAIAVPIGNVAATADIASVSSTQVTTRIKHRDAGQNFGANVDFYWLAIA